MYITSVFCDKKSITLCFLRNFSVRFLLLVACLFLTGCSKSEEMGQYVTPSLPDKNIYILYDNDVHGNLEGYVKMAALKSECLESSPYVTTVSCGDFTMGTSPVGMTKGMAAIHVMNALGYDIAIMGNHEFDNGIEFMQRIMNDSLQASVLSSNFCSLPSGELLFPAYRIIHYGKTKIGFIGITTPTAAKEDSPASFLNEASEPIYGFMPETFVERMQNTVDELRRKGTDYVVVLSHLGENDSYEGIYKNTNSCYLINQTTGIDVVLDGHSHHIFADSILYNKEGKRVHLSQTGTKFENMGLLTLDTLGNFSTQLIASNTYYKEDAAIKTLVENEIEKASAQGNRIIGYSEVDVPCTDANGNRTVRNQESQVGDFVADAFRIVCHTDIALIHGGGIRSDIKAGDVTYNNIFDVFPFDNTVVTATLTGKELADILEYTCNMAPTEFGSFLQVSGIRYDMNGSVKVDYLTDPDTELFMGIREGAPRRVTNIKILNKVTNEYEYLNPAHDYTIAIPEYMAQNGFEYGILRGMKNVSNTGIVDCDVVCEYIKTYLNGIIPARYANLNGRINIIGH